MADLIGEHQQGSTSPTQSFTGKAITYGGLGVGGYVVGKKAIKKVGASKTWATVKKVGNKVVSTAKNVLGKGGAAAADATGTAVVDATGAAAADATGAAAADATGTAVVDATGAAAADATGTAVVDATGAAAADATGTAVVDATGTAVVDATGTAVVDATGTAVVDATGTAVVDATGTAVVDATGAAAVESTGLATVGGETALAETGTGLATVSTETGLATVEAGAGAAEAGAITVEGAVPSGGLTETMTIIDVEAKSASSVTAASIAMSVVGITLCVAAAVEIMSLIEVTVYTGLLSDSYMSDATDNQSTINICKVAINNLKKLRNRADGDNHA